MNIEVLKHRFMLLGEHAGTIVEVEVADKIKATIFLSSWVNTNPAELENMTYYCIQPAEEEKVLIFFDSTE